MISLNWQQVSRWRLAQQYLLKRADSAQMLNVVSALGGLHAQMMSAAELQVWARVNDADPEAVQNALWRDRTLVKTWVFRGTLHLVTAQDFPLYVAALSTLKHFRRASWQKYHGVSSDELDAIIEGARVLLTDQGQTREQLANALAAHTRLPKLAELLRSGWGMVLKPVAFQGDLCFGPSDGQNVTFVRPARWLGEWTPIAPETAVPEAARRFLRTYGPATVDEFARWFGFEPSAAKRAFRALKDEIVEVDVKGWKASALAESAEAMQALKPLTAPVVNLLPNFDPYTLAVARHSDALLPDAFKGRVYRPQGWISPVVLVNGSIAGVWEYEKQRTKIVVSVELFAAPPAVDVEAAITAEAERLGRYFDLPAEIVLRAEA